MRDEAGTLAPESSDRNKVISSISVNLCVEKFYSYRNYSVNPSSISCLCISLSVWFS